MTASTRSRFERWSGGMPLSVPVAFGAVLVIAAPIGAGITPFSSPRA